MAVPPPGKQTRLPSLPYLYEHDFDLHLEINLKSIMWMIWSEQYNKLFASYVSVCGDIFMSYIHSERELIIE